MFTVNSWIWLSRSKTKRSWEEQDGDPNVHSVALGNILACRVVLFVMLLICKDCIVLLEQPLSSVTPCSDVINPPSKMKLVNDQLIPWGYYQPSGLCFCCFEICHCSPYRHGWGCSEPSPKKPTKLWNNQPWITVTGNSIQQKTSQIHRLV